MRSPHRYSSIVGRAAHWAARLASFVPIGRHAGMASLNSRHLLFFVVVIRDEHADAYRPVVDAATGALVR